eukprot:TRINITY_DN12666_c0_g1_i1.p1 TRINITY_DN12666_c0_g1~~TRINITY_DN12666_c0_g1_i1.p1  ORF type:complete len:564 (+),score=59.17 TRINITY_DN12666_c0_g1_i1:66-1694(+)
MGLGLKKYIFQFIAGNSRLISLVLCLACCVVTVLLPVSFSRGTYFSENSLNIGQSDTLCTDSDVGRIEAYAARLEQYSSDSDRMRSFLQSELTESGVQPRYQKTDSGSIIFSTTPSHRGVGSSAFLVVAHAYDFTSVGILLQIINKAKNSVWLGLDLHTLIVLSGDYEAGIHHFTTLPSISFQTILGAVVLDFGNDFLFQTLHIQTLSSNGMQPNMDFVNSASLLADSARIQSTVFLSDASEDDVPESIRDIIGSNWDIISDAPNMRAKSPSELFKNISNFWKYLTQAVTSDTPAVHTPLRNAGVHTLTLSGRRSEKRTSRSKISSVCYIVLQLIRGINNLSEKLHQSFWIYFYTNGNHFVDYDQIQMQIWMGAGSVISASFLFKITKFDAVSFLLVCGVIVWSSVGGIVKLMPPIAVMLGSAMGFSFCDKGCVHLVRVLLSFLIVSYLAMSTVMYPSVGVLAAVHVSLITILTLPATSSAYTILSSCAAIFITHLFDQTFSLSKDLIPWSYHIVCVPFTAICVSTSLQHAFMKPKQSLKTD